MLSSVDSSYIFALRIEYMPQIAVNNAIISRTVIYLHLELIICLEVQQMILSSVDSSYIFALRIEYMPPIAANDAIISRQQLYIYIKN